MIAALAAVALAVPSAVPADIPKRFARLGIAADQPYRSVRRRLVRAGYAPARLRSGACATAGGRNCAAFPEIEACAGTGAGLCSARFVAARRRSLAVVTVGPAGPLVRIFEQEQTR